MEAEQFHWHEGLTNLSRTLTHPLTEEHLETKKGEVAAGFVLQLKKLHFYSSQWTEA